MRLRAFTAILEYVIGLRQIFPLKNMFAGLRIAFTLTSSKGKHVRERRKIARQDGRGDIYSVTLNE